MPSIKWEYNWQCFSEQSYRYKNPMHNFCVSIMLLTIYLDQYKTNILRNELCIVIWSQYVVLTILQKIVDCCCCIRWDVELIDFSPYFHPNQNNVDIHRLIQLKTIIMFMYYKLWDRIWWQLVLYIFFRLKRADM